MKPGSKFAIVIVVALLTGACAQEQKPELILSKLGAVQLRAMQSRMFETNDRRKVVRAIIATFQDLGYSVTKVEPAVGTVSADKLSKLKMTATVYPRGDSRMIVRANAIVKLVPAINKGHQVDKPEFYQQRFFDPLSKALFLTALQVEDDPGEDPTTPSADGAPTGG